MGCPDHLLDLNKKWEEWCTLLMDRKELAMVSVVEELEAFKAQMVVVMSPLILPCRVKKN